jgi:hypothetical protein
MTGRIILIVKLKSDAYLVTVAFEEESVTFTMHIEALEVELLKGDSSFQKITSNYGWAVKQIIKTVFDFHHDKEIAFPVQLQLPNLA